MSAVFQHVSGLLFIKRNLFLLLVFDSILLEQQMTDNIAFFYSSVKDLVAVFRLYFRVQNPLRFNPHKRPHLTESVASAFFYADLPVSMGDLRPEMYFHIRMIFHQFTHSLIYFARSACQASCPGTDQNPASAVCNLCFRSFPYLSESFSVCNSLHTLMLLSTLESTPPRRPGSWPDIPCHLP